MYSFNVILLHNKLEYRITNIFIICKLLLLLYFTKTYQGQARCGGWEGGGEGGGEGVAFTYH